MIKAGVIIMALVSFLNAGWFSNLFDDTPKPPIAVPIDLSKAGSVVKVDMRSDDSEKYRYFSLYFVKGMKKKYPDGRSSWVYFYKHSPWFNKFTGAGGQANKRGTKTPVRLTIYRLEKDKKPILFFNETIESEGIIGFGARINGQEISYLNRYINAIELPKGKYHIKLENLKDFPELKDVKVYFAIHGGRGKY